MERGALSERRRSKSSETVRNPVALAGAGEGHCIKRPILASFKYHIWGKRILRPCFCSFATGMMHFLDKPMDFAI